ncbi:MAG: hypothetical protein ACYTFZ_09590 [Planctomycetota bacterium]|jgi:hypothetical protein
MARERCEHTYVFDPKAFADGKNFRTMVRKHRQCRRRATTTRPAFRWGDQSRGESAVIHYDAPLCRWCAESWDEAKAEGEAEARCS